MSNELQDKLARRRHLNGESSGNCLIEECATALSPKAAAVSPKRKCDTELDTKLTRRRILNGEGLQSERLSQFGGAATKQHSPHKKRSTTLFNLEQRLLGEELFRVSQELSQLQYATLVTAVKAEVTLRGKSSQEIVRFLLTLQQLTSTNISSQLNGLTISNQDDMVPVLMNVFVRAMVGPDRIHLSVFDSVLERDCYSAMSDLDKTSISNTKAIAETAHNWLIMNQFIDICAPITGSVDVKIAMFGSYGTGKSALIARYVTGAFTGETAPTIGLDVQTKVTALHGVECKAALWDTAGQERYHAITESFLRGVDGVFVVYDACRPGVLPEKERLQLKKLLRDESVPTVLFGNKTDLLQDKNMLLKYRRPSHFMGSALTGEGVEEAFRYITAAALEKKLSTQLQRHEQQVGDKGVRRGHREKQRIKLQTNGRGLASASSSSGSSCCV